MTIAVAPTLLTFCELVSEIPGFTVSLNYLLGGRETFQAACDRCSRVVLFDEALDTFRAIPTLAMLGEMREHLDAHAHLAGSSEAMGL